ncbi:MAG: winged helix-turn-helix domain-containing protein [Acidobacteria bacterium]|nr:winged helix-turn-helix domain-containing protein [Acidobacteriota bacterium]
MSPSHFYEFLGFRLDPDQRLLFRNGEVVPLAPKALDTLLLLVENHGRILEKDVLLKHVWPDTFVEEGSLTRNISVLRKVLEEGLAGVACIENIPKRGYRFVAEVRSVPADHKSRSTTSEQPGGAGQSTASVDTRKPRLSPAWRIPVLIAAILIAVIATPLVLNVHGWRDAIFGTSAGNIQSIAVLPLENLSNDPEQAYFADGMTDALITDLAKISSLRVVSRTSVMQYKGARKSIPQVARELGVDAVVEGTVTRAGNQVRITAQLIAARNDRHLWAEMYQRDLGDALIMQGQVAQAIADSVRLELTADERSRLSSLHRVDPEAYELYLRGRYYWNRRDAEGLTQAIEYFRSATRRDPNFALAYAGLADCYNVISDSVSIPATEALGQAKIASLKALELDANSAEAHASLAWVRFQLDWNWADAEHEFRRAISLNPGYATAHHWFAIFLSAMGRGAEAIAEAKRAQELDPLSLIIRLDVGSVYFWTGHVDLSLQQELKVLDMDPTFVRGYFYVAIAYAHMRRLDDALSYFHKGAALAGGGTQPFQELEAWFYAASGRRREAFNILAKLESPAREPAESYYIAEAYAALGKRDEAFKWLERAYRERTFWMVYLNVDPRLDSLRSDPRFHDLVSRVGLAPATP